MQALTGQAVVGQPGSQRSWRQTCTGTCIWACERFVRIYVGSAILAAAACAAVAPAALVLLLIG
jgi:hypothetical protein